MEIWRISLLRPMWVLTAPARYILRALSCDHHDKRKWKLLSFLKKDSCCMQMPSNARHLLMIHLFDLQPNMPLWVLANIMTQFSCCFWKSFYLPLNSWLSTLIVRGLFLFGFSHNLAIPQVYSQLISNICTDALSAEKVMSRGSHPPTKAIVLCDESKHSIDMEKLSHWLLFSVPAHSFK